MASGSSLLCFDALSKHPPATLYATELAFAGGSTPAERERVLAFDPTTVWYMDWLFVMPTYYAGNGIVLVCEFSMVTDTTITNKIKLDAAFRRRQVGTTTFASSKSYSYQSSGAVSIPSATDIVALATINFSNSQIDSLAVGETGVLRIKRDTSVASNSTGVMKLHKVHMKEA